MTFTIVSPPTLYLSLPEFEDYLSGQHQRVTEATRMYMQERRVFFCRKARQSRFRTAVVEPAWRQYWR